MSVAPTGAYVMCVPPQQNPLNTQISNNVDFREMFLACNERTHANIMGKFDFTSVFATSMTSVRLSNCVFTLMLRYSCSRKNLHPAVAVCSALIGW